tara:strand:+ start:131 stop:805 length:675 start_codon:yes stop_codon:yes gene_type:complete
LSSEKIEKLLVEHQMNFLKNLEVVLSGFIHDLNNSAAVISGQSSIMKTLVEMNKMNDEKTLKGSIKILNSTKKMAVIIQGLRDFYKPTTLDNTNANIKLSIDTIYKLSIPKIYRNDLEVEFKAFEEEKNVVCVGNPLILNLLFWNIHYLFLDTLEKNTGFSLNLSCTNSEKEAVIIYSFNNGELASNYLETSDMIAAKSFAKAIGGEIESSSPKSLSIRLKLID